MPASSSLPLTRMFPNERLASNTVLALIVPAAVLAIPIFDTTLVTIVRRLNGRPVSQGGRDHTSHRLVAARAE